MTRPQAPAAPMYSGTAAGVPFVALPPSGRPPVPGTAQVPSAPSLPGRHDTDDTDDVDDTQDTQDTQGAPVVVGWHLLAPPRTERAFAAALPLIGLDAWRIYFGVPMCGARLPAGGIDELARLIAEDAVLNVYGPVTEQVLAEYPAAYAALRDRFHLAASPSALLGGSIGGAIAASVLTASAPDSAASASAADAADSGSAADAADVAAVVLVNPLLQLHESVMAMAAAFGVTYSWSEPAEQVAQRLDFVARADQIAARGEPAVLLVVGEQDSVDGFRLPAVRLRSELAARYRDPARAELVIIPGMGHPLADEPGTEPAPQTAHAAEVDALAVAWLRRHLGVYCAPVLSTGRTGVARNGE